MKALLPPYATAIAAFLLGFTPLLQAQTIPNPSFEADTFTNSPGYVSGNGPITSWAGDPATAYGLNPSGGSPFANNGVVPDGTNAAFLQHSGSFTSISNTISGLTAGQPYRLQFRTTARSGNNPLLRVNIDGTTKLLSRVNGVGVNSPYRYVILSFNATGSTAEFQLFNEAAPDNTVVVDDFRVFAGASNWTASAWADDATTSLPTGHRYTHAYNFGSSASPVINQVGFTGAPGASPAVAGRFALTGQNLQFTGDANNLAEASRALANDFVYNGQPATLTLSGLTAGRDYTLTLYSVGWEVPGNRWITFRHGTNGGTFDQNTFDNNNGIVFSCSYTADANGTAIFEMGPVSGASFHLYGFANRESAPLTNALPTFSTPPPSISAFTGAEAFFSIGVTGSAPITYQWLRNGVAIAGATNPTYLRSVVNGGDAAFYALRATNAAGTATSSGTFLEVQEVVPNVIFDTGLDATGVLQADTLLDAHYSLELNPDNVGVRDAFVQNSTLFPIVAGPWLANSSLSKWIGPRAETSGAAGPNPTVYQYRTIVDLTSRPAAFLIAGRWAVDNIGNAIFVNGVQVPNITPSTGFGSLTPFRIDSALLPAGTVIQGINNIDFQVVNSGAGYTGLRIEGSTFSSIPANIAPVVIEQPVGRGVTTGESVTLSVRAYGTATLAYQWRRNGQVLTGETGRTLTLNNYSNSLDGNYTVTVTNPVSSTQSSAAALTALDVPAFVTTPPSGGLYGVGDTVTFTAQVGGSLPLNYQWTFNGADLPGKTSPTLVLTNIARTQAGNYRLRVSNAFGSPATSAPAAVMVQDVVPGVFNTGVDITGAPLEDNSLDEHYTLMINPDGEPLAPPVVINSTVFPISAGPWVPSSPTSKWIGPRFDTSASAAGDYSYRTVLDLSNFDFATVTLSGQWATDNNGTAIRVNGEATGLTNTVTFTGLTSFTIPPGRFIRGINTIDFNVNNAAVGYTGLHVQKLRALGDPAARIILPVLVPSINSSGQFTLSFIAQANYRYTIEFSESLMTGGWLNPRPVPTPAAGGAATWTETQTLRPRGFYRVIAAPASP